jgi:hypothetical protein
MRSLQIAHGACIVLLAQGLFAQTKQPEQPGLWFLDKQSQSNVVVTVSDFGGPGKPCPPPYTNTLTNRNLFTLEQERMIRETFVKYKDVTTNSGPVGTVLSDLYKTNFVIQAMNKNLEIETFVADFRYTNVDAHELIRLGSGLSAELRTKSGDGYRVSLTRTGGGTTLLSFTQTKASVASGVAVRFRDAHAQGPAWDYRRASFSESGLFEYKQYTNRLVFGKFLMWDPNTGNLTVEAEFKEPFDMERHRTDLQMRGSGSR